MPRTLTDHKLTGLNDGLTITVLDEPGPGGANHQYSIRWTNERDQTEPHCFIGFQNGPIKDTGGINGISNEALLAIVIDRLQGFQHGPTWFGKDEGGRGEFACRENAIALTHLETALMFLQKRTRDRIARGVEGTMQK
jgi:hypothetical protein